MGAKWVSGQLLRGFVRFSAGGVAGTVVVALVTEGLSPLVFVGLACGVFVIFVLYLVQWPIGRWLERRRDERKRAARLYPLESTHPQSDETVAEVYLGGASERHSIAELTERVGRTPSRGQALGGAGSDADRGVLFAFGSGVAATSSVDEHMDALVPVASQLADLIASEDRFFEMRLEATQRYQLMTVDSVITLDHLWLELLRRIGAGVDIHTMASVGDISQHEPMDVAAEVSVQKWRLIPSELPTNRMETRSRPELGDETWYATLDELLSAGHPDGVTGFHLRIDQELSPGASSHVVLAPEVLAMAHPRIDGVCVLTTVLPLHDYSASRDGGRRVDGAGNT